MPIPAHAESQPRETYTSVPIHTQGFMYKLIFEQRFAMAIAIDLVYSFCRALSLASDNDKVLNETETETETVVVR